MRPVRAVLAGLVLVGALVLNGEGPRPAAPNMPRPPGAPAEPVVPEANSTRLEIEFFQVNCPVEKLRAIDVRGMERDARTLDEIMKRLGEIGDATMPVRMSNVVDLGQNSTLTQGTRLPTVQSVMVNADGKITPSISYNEVGTIVNVTGAWEGSKLYLRGSIELSSVVRTGVEVTKGVKLPAFDQLKIQQQITLHEGQPVLILVNGQSALVPATMNSGVDSAEPRCTATIARLTAWRLGEKRE